MIEARIVADSINFNENRITTWILKVHRYVLSEINTHKMLSKNSASSRAQPINNIINNIKNDPAMPVHWGKLQKGMQAFEELNEEEIEECQQIWLEARDNAIESAEKLLKIGLHKQVVNRLLEPWSWQTILMTGTDFQNFFALRANEMAQPEFRELAYKMLELYNNNIPKLLNIDDWHIPFSDKYCDGLTLEEKLIFCTARAARVSYDNFEGEIEHQKDFDLHDRLFAEGHFSPFEHSAQNKSDDEYYANLKGWKPYRKFFMDENRKDARVKIHDLV